MSEGVCSVNPTSNKKKRRLGRGSCGLRGVSASSRGVVDSPHGLAQRVGEPGPTPAEDVGWVQSGPVLSSSGRLVATPGMDVVTGQLADATLTGLPVVQAEAHVPMGEAVPMGQPVEAPPPYRPPYAGQ